MLAGFGKENIDPPAGAELSGYGYYLERKNTGAMDHLYARCLYLENPEEKFAVVSCDLIGLSPEICAAARELARTRLGIAPEKLMICATHTHTGPASARLEGCGVMHPGYAASLPEKIFAAVKKAAEDKAQVTEEKTADAKIEPIGFNRAIAGGPHDDHVRGALFARSGRSSVALLSYACHPVTLGPLDRFSPDYPGEVCQCFEEQGVSPVFLTGICGDIDPVNNLIKWGSGTKEIIRGYGERIFEGFYKKLTPAEPAFGTDHFETELPVVPLKPEELDSYRERAGHEKTFAAWKKAMTELEPATDRERIEIRAVRTGDLVFASVPYEAFTCIGDRLREAFPNAFVAGCSDGIRGYLPSREDWDGGAYAAIGAAFIYLRPFFAKGAAELLGETLRDRLAETLR